MKRGMMGKEEAKMMLAISMMLRLGVSTSSFGIAGNGEHSRPDHVADEGVGLVSAGFILHEEDSADDGSDQSTVWSYALVYFPRGKAFGCYKGVLTRPRCRRHSQA